jgi:AhpD family alkylhydroperoxidase
MSPRLNAFTAAPEATKAMLAVEAAIEASGLEHGLLELVRIRASQINGCAVCLYMHTADARKHGESEMRINLLGGWRDSSLYTDRERAALGWTEALTRVASKGAPDEDYDRLQEQFSVAEQGNLTVAIGAINLWNRVQIGARAAHPVEAAKAAA